MKVMSCKSDDEPKHDVLEEKVEKSDIDLKNHVVKEETRNDDNKVELCC